MYTRKIQLANYGPIEALDIGFPFDGDNPQPVVLVGENGSGKSILLSHIVNGLISSKGVAFPETPEVESGKVYKLRSSFYIKSGSEYYFGRVDFEDSFFTSEIRTLYNKQEYSDIPTGISGTAAQDIWEKMDSENNDHYDSNFSNDSSSINQVKDIFSKNCILYFPFNRFEEPAWLNEYNLKAQAQYMNMQRLIGHTNRRVINYSSFHDNKDWLFDVYYDRSNFEMQHHTFPVDFHDGRGPVPITALRGHSGQSTNTYMIAEQILRSVTRGQDVRFNIGGRHNRAVSIISGVGANLRQLVPNIFQLSSGETALLNLFLSILRDFDLCGSPFSSAADIRGIVVVDEIDLHLHTIHQYEVLPSLIQMFPRVQFIVTTHSPLFVLGMQRLFGEYGFALYRLPQGDHISAEEFSEFGNAYQALTETIKFSVDLRTAIEDAQKPIVFVEGTTDQQYLRKASQRLGYEALLESVEIKDGGGVPGLKNIWNRFKPPLSDITSQQIVLLYDCEQQIPPSNRGSISRQSIPLQSNNPIKEGIENLFNEDTIEKARRHRTAFIDIDPGRTKTIRGKPQDVLEIWTVNEDEKTNLCDWLCENGTPEDFQGFRVVFELLKGHLGLHSQPSEDAVQVEGNTANPDTSP